MRDYNAVSKYALLIQHKDVETFDELLRCRIRQKAAEGEMFIRFDLKPPFPDTPDELARSCRECI